VISIQITESLALDEAQSTHYIALLEKAAKQVLQDVYADPDVDATLVLSDDDQLHRLNLQFLEVDAPTDVLSFPAGEIDPDSQTIYLGDVILSYSRAMAQAEAGSHPVEAELQLLAVHGNDGSLSFFLRRHLNKAETA